MSNGIDLPDAVLRIENSLGGVAGEALGAERTFDISQVGDGLFGPGVKGGAGKINPFFRSQFEFYLSRFW